MRAAAISTARGPQLGEPSRPRGTTGRTRTASAVLADGRVLIEGGEYNLGGPFSLTNQGAIYDPVADAWTQVDPPPGWDFIGDASSIVMPNGKFLLGNKLDQRIVELDPATMTWTELGSAGKTGLQRRGRLDAAARRNVHHGRRVRDAEHRALRLY